MIENNEKPFLTVGALCERVLQEKDGILSAIRLVDRIQVVAEIDAASEQMPAVPINLQALICLKTGPARGKRTVKVVAHTPNGSIVPSPEEFTALFSDETPGVNFVIDLMFGVNLEGWYWFDVVVGDDIITRMPLQVMYIREPNAQLKHLNRISGVPDEQSRSPQE